MKSFPFIPHSFHWNNVYTRICLPTKPFLLRLLAFVRGWETVRFFQVFVFFKEFCICHWNLEFFCGNFGRNINGIPLLVHSMRLVPRIMHITLLFFSRKVFKVRICELYNIISTLTGNQIKPHVTYRLIVLVAGRWRSDWRKALEVTHGQSRLYHKELRQTWQHLAAA